MPLFLANLLRNSPDLLVDRTGEIRWLEQRITAYLYDRSPDKGAVITVLGAKGSGKSILTNKVFATLSQRHGTYVAFVTVDCRQKLTQREVLRQIADGLHKELADMRSRGSAKITEELLDTVGVVKTLAQFSNVKLRRLHENLTRLKKASDLKIGGKLLDFLNAEFSIVVSREEQDRQAIEGEILIDDTTLRQALIHALHDVRAQDPQLDVIIYLDNIDEIDHDAIVDDTKRERVRAETLGLLDLCRARVGLVLNLRTYYSSSLLRRGEDILNLGALAPDHLREMLEVRVATEREETRRALESDDWKATIDELCKASSTPLAFLRWFKFLAEWADDRRDRSLAERLAGYSGQVAANISVETLRRVAMVFRSSTRTVPREELLGACGGSESVLRQLMHAQVILPRDFWEPNEFTLDPEMQYLLAAGVES